MLNTLNNFIRIHKDCLDHGSNSNVIYKLNCASCNAFYVGQTSRQLRTRVVEHQRNFSANYNRQSVVDRHRSDLSHDFC